MVMSRNNHEVRFAASNYYWNFGFRGKDKSRFCCTVNPTKSRQAGNSTSDTSKTLSILSPRIWKDVAVTIGRGRGERGERGEPVRQEEFSTWLDGFLDISRPQDPSDIIETDSGDLILDQKFSGRVYLKGLLLPATNLGVNKVKYG